MKVKMVKVTVCRTRAGTENSLNAVSDRRAICKVLLFRPTSASRRIALRL